MANIAGLLSLLWNYHYQYDKGVASIQQASWIQICKYLKRDTI